MRPSLRAVAAFSVILLLLCGVLRVRSDEGPDDYAELDPARDPATPLLPNATGPEVVALQNALNGVTFYVQPKGSPPTGVFDDATSDALLQFQAMAGVAESERGSVSTSTMQQFDLFLGLQACAPYGIARLGQEDVTDAISTGAVDVLNAYWSHPVGTLVPFMADGQTFVGRIELHFHPYDGPTTPYGYHHGVSVYEYVRDEGGDWLLAMTGSEFLQFSASMSLPQRDDQILLQLALLNAPPSLLTREAVEQTPPPVSGSSVWMPVTATSPVGSAEPHAVTFYVLKDYLSIGRTDDDFVRVPIAAYTAQKLADVLGASSLPTCRMVDLTWAAATSKVEPQPLSPTDEMCSNAYVERENGLVEEELRGLVNDTDTNASFSSATLFVGGDKKDTVLTGKYEEEGNADSVAEYGWHQLDGSPIQPLYLGHSSNWADYSMGIRLVSGAALVDGQTWMPLVDILQDAELAPLLSDEGAIATPRVPINPRTASECWVFPQ